MKSGQSNPNKELYNQLRVLSCEQLWEVEVPRFDRASHDERVARVSLIRAIGVVFSEQGTMAQKNLVRPWLRSLLKDPVEKIRRYAMTALPKIGAGAGEEAELLDLLSQTTADREKKFLGQTLAKIGGEATLEAVGAVKDKAFTQAALKIKASLARDQNPSSIQLDRPLTNYSGLMIHLHGRRGLEQFMRAEVEDHLKRNAKFRMTDVRSGVVALTPMAPFALKDIYALRCFGTVGFVLGKENAMDEADARETLARIIASPLTRRIMTTFTEGSLRYRLDFVARGHQRGAVQALANRAYALCPDILNDSHEAAWTIAIYPTGRGGHVVELSPKASSDPRFAYRQQDVPAASHPPLAASMARLAGKVEGDIIWDPFCGSGIELIEKSLLGGVKALYGTDLSVEAIDIAERNIAAAKLKNVATKLVCADFRRFATSEELGAESVNLVISNPPMGKRVPIPNLRGLIFDLFDVAAHVLKPGGRLVFANPIFMDDPHRALKLQSRQMVDFGGFDCRVEKYIKVGK